MFTIFNVINYFTGKYIPLSLLVLITIGIYYYVITSWFDNIYSNDIYVYILLILMLIDITSLIVIFMYGDFYGTYSSQNLNTNLNTNIKLKKNKKNKKNKNINKKNINKKEEINILNKPKQILEDDKGINTNEDKEIISLYDNKKSGSINTFENKYI